MLTVVWLSSRLVRAIAHNHTQLTRERGIEREQAKRGLGLRPGIDDGKAWRQGVSTGGLTSGDHRGPHEMRHGTTATSHHHHYYLSGLKARIQEEEAVATAAHGTECLQLCKLQHLNTIQSAPQKSTQIQLENEIPLMVAEEALKDDSPEKSNRNLTKPLLNPSSKFFKAQVKAHDFRFQGSLKSLSRKKCSGSEKVS
ncbi:hypothetical protein Cgig2_022668 [Carnegiea gigantea]|uniref:Uncharacterized protein n=1 Tax=Carnegiea gigantea TaxID=171969 RepID=A0A9Q1GJS8_9CARY|nr:hypothetical protein Cgig2_022668 [Carnegiea gigantea]